MAIKQFRNWFFQVTGIPGTRFLKHNKPTESVMRDFLESIGFIKEVSDTASTTQQGFVKKATNAQIASRVSNDGGFTLGVTPAQLPKVTLNGVPIIPTQDSTGTQTYDVTASTSTTTVSENGTPITPVAGNYNVSTWLETQRYSISGIVSMPANASNPLTTAYMTNIGRGMTLQTAYLAPSQTTAFSWESSTGTLTFTKSGWYNVHAWAHFGENLTDNVWIKGSKAPDVFIYDPGNFIMAINRSAGASSGVDSFDNISNIVFYTGNGGPGTVDAAGPAWWPQHYADLNCLTHGIYKNAGDKIQIWIQNNTHHSYVTDGTSGLVNLSVQLLALD
jgi:hypothetical protein